MEIEFNIDCYINKIGFLYKLRETLFFTNLQNYSAVKTL